VLGRDGGRFVEDRLDGLTDGFKLSNHPLLAEKAHDIVGLYLEPPEAAVVLSVDEKSQVQARARSQPAFPLIHGRARNRIEKPSTIRGERQFTLAPGVGVVEQLVGEDG
jgi:hypothetical protein